MPNDIRSFFGGKPAASTTPAPQPKPSTGKRGRSRKVVDEDSDDEVAAKKPTPAKKKAPTPEAEATSKDDYFGKSKPKRSEVVKKSTPATNGTAATPKASPAKAKSTPKSAASTKSTSNGRSTRKKAPVEYKEEDFDEDLDVDDVKVLKQPDDEADDIFAADFKTIGKGLGDDYEEDEDGDDEDLQPKRRNNGSAKQTKVKPDDNIEPLARAEDVDMKDVNADEDFVMPDADERVEVDTPAKAATAKATAARKRKSQDLDEEDEEEEPPKKKGPKKDTPKTSPKKPAARKAKKMEVQDSTEIQAIHNSIPLVRPPTPPGGDQKKNFKFGGGGHANSGPAPAEGSIEIPDGAPNCLAGLSFVFTGLLTSLDRPKGQELVKRYGGKVVGAPSKKTDYVVLGADAGPKKLETIREHGLKTIDENGLFELIRRLPAGGGDSKAGKEAESKQEKEMEKVRQAAAEMEKQERAVGAGASSKTTQAQSSKGKATDAGVDSRLWTVKYAPTDLKQICGNKSQVDSLQNWLRNFRKNQRKGFKLPGANGMGVYRAVIISGPPGIGKTTAAHLVARLEGYDVVESNASDTRSKKLVEAGLKGVLDTTSLLGYFAGDGQKTEDSKKKLCLIMDEVDGMSAGDRGGVGALAAVCKKSIIPMILICNDRKLPKMKPFDYCTYNMVFRRPTTEMIRSRIMTIAYREGMKLPPNVINALIEGTGADIRQVVNMLSTAKIDAQSNEMDLDFDSGKKMSKAWEKHAVLKPWDIVHKILGGGLFYSSSKATLNDKIELYFNDHEFSSLMLQENYLGTKPSIASDYRGKEQAYKTLELAEKAASSISEGDLVDRMIHGSQQQWSLMPTHAVMSFVRPASYVAGLMAGGSQFTSWLGKNSNQQKLMRMVKEIQGHMRLRCSADRHAIRQHYLPQLWAQLVKRLELQGKESVPAIIEVMDSYFLTRDDWDAIMELGVGPMAQDGVKIESQAKATFTRQYNDASHPLPFMKASNVVAPKKQKKERPDLEEAIDESDEADFVEEAPDREEDEEGELDLSKDKYVKAPKKKKAAPAKKGKKGVKEEDEEVEEKPAASKGKGKAKGKAK